MAKYGRYILEMILENNPLNWLNFSINCEPVNVTLSRLDDALDDAGILDESYMCVASDKTTIKEKLKEACR